MTIEQSIGKTDDFAKNADVGDAAGDRGFFQCFGPVGLDDIFGNVERFCRRRVEP